MIYQCGFKYHHDVVQMLYSLEVQKKSSVWLQYIFLCHVVSCASCDVMWRVIHVNYHRTFCYLSYCSTHEHTQTLIHTYMYTHTYHTHIHTQHTYIHTTYTHTHTHTRTHTHIHTHAHTHTHTYTHTHTHTHAHTHTHTHTHTCRRSIRTPVTSSMSTFIR